MMFPMMVSMITSRRQNRPTFGFRTMVRLVDNQPCIKDVSCDLEGNLLNAQERQSREDFSVDAPPRCRSVRDARDSCKRRSFYSYFIAN